MWWKKQWSTLLESCYRYHSHTKKTKQKTTQTHNIQYVHQLVFQLRQTGAKKFLKHMLQTTTQQWANMSYPHTYVRTCMYVHVHTYIIMCGSGTSKLPHHKTIKTLWESFFSLNPSYSYIAGQLTYVQYSTVQMSC